MLRAPRDILIVHELAQSLHPRFGRSFKMRVILENWIRLSSWNAKPSLYDQLVIVIAPSPALAYRKHSLHAICSRAAWTS
jgi:hypothetical protein